MGIEALAKFSARRAWWTVLFWIVLIGVSGFLISQFLSGALTTEQGVSKKIEADTATNLVKDRLNSGEDTTELVIVKSSRFKISDSEFQTFVTDTQKDLEGLGKEVVKGTASYYQTKNPALVSQDQNATIIITTLKGSTSEAEKNIDKVDEVVKNADEDRDFSAIHSGQASVNQGFQNVAEKDLQKGEFLGVPIALIILVLVFGAVAAAFLPIILAFLAIALALAVSAIFGHFSSLSFFVTNMITMMGLAVGIDYSLFVVARFREERARGMEKHAAIANSGRTASKAVFFSGITVVVALAGLLFVPSNIFRSLSLGAIFVVVAAVLAALTLLPAVLSILGDKINFLSVPFFRNTGLVNTEKGFWSRVARVVMAYPWISLELSVGFLLLLTLPVLFINIGSSGVESLPENLQAKEGFIVLQTQFSPGILSPTQIVVDGDVSSFKTREEINALENELKKQKFVSGTAVQINQDKKIAVVNVFLDTTGVESTKAIKDIRNLKSVKSLNSGNTKVYVGGQDAQQADFTQVIRDYTPIVFLFVLSLSFVFLTLAFRSLVVPVKAILMNLLSVGAAYGLLVLVFQFGVGARFFGFQQAPQIESWIPLFLFAILFGLSMDYHVFLLSRIKEKFNQTKNNTESVTFGLVTTASLITGAALIMVVVFSGFAAGQLVMFEQVGFGLAAAILIDATIIRTILVPASMKLLGNWNWYLPKWLNWIPKVGIEG